MTLEENSSNYKEYCRPKVAHVLSLLKLDVTYYSAQGDYMYYKNNQGDEIKVVDFIGGFGSTILGHNNPEVNEIVRERLKNKGVFHAQMSSRDNAGALCAKLNKILKQRTNKSFVTTLANSGAEAVEISLKHAEFSHFLKIKTILKNLHKNIDHISKELDHRISLSENYKRVVKDLEIDQERRLERQLFLLFCHNQKILETSPLLVSLSRAFHGKTLGALQLTFDSTFRYPFKRLDQNIFFSEP